MAQAKYYCSVCNDYHDYPVDDLLVWKHRLEVLMELNGEKPKDIVYSAPPDLGDYNGLFVNDDRLCFTVWTADRVYFPYEYDGHTDIHWVFRNPSEIRTPECGFQHVR